MELVKENCSSCEISVYFRVKRSRFGKRHFDEIDDDRRLNIIEENLRIKVFLPVIDTVVFQLDNRFQSLKIIIDNFNFLSSTLLVWSNENDIEKASYDFLQYYNEDISSDFTIQLLSIRTLTDLEKTKTIKQLAIFIIENDFCIIYIEVLSIIYITLSCHSYICGTIIL